MTDAETNDLRKWAVETLAQRGEPVAWMDKEGYLITAKSKPDPMSLHVDRFNIPLYTAPPAPQHTEAEVQEIFQACYSPLSSRVETVRRILGVEAPK